MKRHLSFLAVVLVLVDVLALGAAWRAGRSAAATPERMLREFCEAIDAIAADQAVVLVLEDLHWSDPATVNPRPARRAAGARVPAGDRDLPAGGRGGLPSLVRLVQQRTDGQPLFVVEPAQELRRRDWLVRTDAGWDRRAGSPPARRPP